MRGKLMLDTGMEQALVVNDHCVPLSGGTVMGTGQFGSDGTFATRLSTAVPEVKVGNLRFAKATRPQTQDARQLEGITPDFIGWVGFWKGYALKLDYRQSEVIFYRGAPTNYLKGESIVAVIPFETRKLPNHPVADVKLGSVAAVAAFDTGQYGTLFTDAKTRGRLLDSGVLRPLPGNADHYDLSRLTIAGNAVADVRRLPVEAGKFPAAAPIGLIEPSILSLKYGFLRSYKTVWDYQHHRLYLLRP